MTTTEKEQPTRRTNAERVEQSRAAILEAAVKQFAEKGFAGASTRAIAKEAGVSQSQLAYHFGSKEGLLTAVFDSLLGRVSEVWSSLEQTSDVAKTLREFVSHIDEPLIGDGTLSRMALRAVAEASPIFMAVQQRIATSIPVIPYIAQRAAAGELRVSNPLLAALSFAGMLHFGLAFAAALSKLGGPLVSAMLGEEASTQEGLARMIVEQGVDVFLYGVLPRGDS